MGVDGWPVGSQLQMRGLLADYFVMLAAESNADAKTRGSVMAIMKKKALRVDFMYYFFRDDGIMPSLCHAATILRRAARKGISPRV